MSRNRKHQVAAVRFGPALRALALCLFVGGSGIGYVWQKELIYTLAERFKQSEIRYERLRQQNERLSRALAAMQTHSALEARIKQLDLGMVAAQPDQIVHLIETPATPESPHSDSERLYADRRPPGWGNP